MAERLRRARLMGAATVIFLGLVAAAVAPGNVRGAQTLCWYVEGFDWGSDGHISINHYWSHRSTWKSWSNPNHLLGRRWYYDTISYEIELFNGGYWDFTNASNNWRQVSIQVWPEPYNPGTNYRAEHWSTIGC